jgi:hypothetical protein
MVPLHMSCNINVIPPVPSGKEYSIRHSCAGIDVIVDYMYCSLACREAVSIRAIHPFKHLTGAWGMQTEYETSPLQSLCHHANLPSVHLVSTVTARKPRYPLRARLGRRHTTKWLSRKSVSRHCARHTAKGPGPKLWAPVRVGLWALSREPLCRCPRRIAEYGISMHGCKRYW